MANPNLQRIKLLKILDLLKKESSPSHPIKTERISRTLINQGINCDRKTVVRDMATLRTYGYDIGVKQIGHETGYYLPVKKKDYSIHEIKKELLEDTRRVEPHYRSVAATDFITRITVKKCSSANHEIEDIQAGVKILLKNYTVSVEILPALYCKSCKKYYLLETEYQTIKNKGILLCNVVEQSYWSPRQGSKKGFYITNQESLLHKMGYNVSASNNLLQNDRQAILKTAIDYDLMTKAEILSHLDYLIKRSQNQASLVNAVEKWKIDREYVRRITKNKSGIIYEPNTIIHNTRKNEW